MDPGVKKDSQPGEGGRLKAGSSLLMSREDESNGV